MTHDEAILRFREAKPGLPPDLAIAEFELLLPARFAMPDVMLPLIDLSLIHISEPTRPY